MKNVQDALASYKIQLQDESDAKARFQRTKLCDDFNTLKACKVKTEKLESELVERLTLASTVSIDYLDLGIDYQDSGAWRSYELSSQGDSLKALIDNATIAEIDQDGGELTCYGMDDASSEVYTAAFKSILNRYFSK